ncbi:MAG: DUF1934 domain-containing protein [Eubacteriales bacterium]|jgi:uncharacterized beta-barrel protein YwiB (DUF1934 family)
MEKKIILKLRSRRVELSSDRYRYDIFTGSYIPGRLIGDMEVTPEVIEFMTEGLLRTEGERCELSYDESELSGLEGSRTMLIFDETLPDTLTMIRSGVVKVTMVFCPGLRHVCRYDNPLIPFELTLMTHSLENSLLTDGRLEIDYTTELAGGGRARTRLTAVIHDAAGDKEYDSK